LIREGKLPLSLWYRIISVPATWVAAAKALDGEPATLEGAVLTDSFEAVGTAGRRKAAAGTKKRGYSALVKADKEDE